MRAIRIFQRSSTDDRPFNQRHYGAHGRILAIYARKHGYSGQGAAVSWLVEAMTEAEWTVVKLETPIFRRGDALLDSALSYAKECLWLISDLIRELTQKSCTDSPCVYISIGQSSVGLLRDGLPYILLVIVGGALPGVVSLHGSWFMNWRPYGAKAIWLKCLISLCRGVTVLGPNQARAMVNLGVRSTLIHCVDNTADLAPIPFDKLNRKHLRHGRRNILFLSNLIDTKGYIEFLSALLLLANRCASAFDATLCGDIVITGYSERFGDWEEADADLQQRLLALRAAGVAINWIKGAGGSEKMRLLHEADIFVFPSRVEAQPISLIEAMASGCAIVSSRVGEIVDTVGDDAGMLLANPDASQVASAIADLLNDPSKCLSLASAARHRFEERFTYRKHAGRWLEIFDRARRANRSSVYKII